MASEEALDSATVASAAWDPDPELEVEWDWPDRLAPAASRTPWYAAWDEVE
jgi:hypothetical protein